MRTEMKLLREMKRYLKYLRACPLNVAERLNIKCQTFFAIIYIRPLKYFRTLKSRGATL